MNGKKILIIDDNEIILKTLSMKLKSGGYEVVTASDLAEGVAGVRQQKPDVILLDISFPPDVGHGGGVFSDGFRLIPWLRRMEEAKDTPIVIISGLPAAGNRERALKEGACAYFQKPINHDELFAAIREVLHEAPAPQPGS